MNNNYNGNGQFEIDTDSDSLAISLIDEVLDNLDPEMIFEEESEVVHCGLAECDHSEAQQDDHISIMDDNQQNEEDNDENAETKSNNDNIEQIEADKDQTNVNIHDTEDIGDEGHENHAFIDDISPAEEHNDDNAVIIGDIGENGHENQANIDYIAQDEEEKLEYEEIGQNQQIEQPKQYHLQYIALLQRLDRDVQQATADIQGLSNKSDQYKHDLNYMQMQLNAVQKVLNRKKAFLAEAKIILLYHEIKRGCYSLLASNQQSGNNHAKIQNALCCDPRYGDLGRWLITMEREQIFNKLHAHLVKHKIINKIYSNKDEFKDNDVEASHIYTTSKNYYAIYTLSEWMEYIKGTEYTTFDLSSMHEGYLWYMSQYSKDQLCLPSLADETIGISFSTSITDWQVTKSKCSQQPPVFTILRIQLENCQRWIDLITLIQPILCFSDDLNIY